MSGDCVRTNHSLSITVGLHYTSFYLFYWPTGLRKRNDYGHLSFFNERKKKKRKKLESVSEDTFAFILTFSFLSFFHSRDLVVCLLFSFKWANNLGDLLKEGKIKEKMRS